MEDWTFWSWCSSGKSVLNRRASGEEASGVLLKLIHVDSISWCQCSQSTNQASTLVIKNLALDFRKDDAISLWCISKINCNVSCDLLLSYSLYVYIIIYIVYIYIHTCIHLYKDLLSKSHKRWTSSAQVVTSLYWVIETVVNGSAILQRSPCDRRMWKNTC